LSGCCVLGSMRQQGGVGAVCVVCPYELYA
jgi:hypothetical protein